jgi:argininosuccinate lyase
MQEDKAPLFDAVDTVKSCIDIYIRMIPKIRVNKKVMHNSAAKGYLNATDFADYLVLKGVNFREAHKLAGKAVAYAIKKKKELNELTIVELKKFSENISEDIFTALDLKEVIDKRKSFGGTATANVAAAIALAEKEIK